jgi:uncharacterized protein (DUF885 family)
MGIIMNRTLAIFTLSVLLTTCGQEAAEPTESRPIAVATSSPVADVNESERLTQWLDARNEELLTMSPMLMTSLGRKDRYDEIDDVSEAAEEAQLTWREQTVEELRKSFDYAALNNEAKVSYDVWVYQYEVARSSAPYIRHGYVFHQMNGSHAGFPNFLINLHSVANADDMEAYISRIAGIATAMNTLVVRARLGAEKGVRPPRFAYEIVLGETAQLISGAPFDANSESDTPLWEDAKTKIEGLLDSGKIDEEQAIAFLAGAKSALLESFGPSYQGLISFLESDYVNTSIEAQGVGSLVDGKNYYDVMLGRMTTTSLTSDEIHEIGLSEVARIKQEMETIKSQVGFEGNLNEFFSYVKSEPDFTYPNDDEGRQGYLDDSTRFIDVMREKLPDYFGMLPKADLEVRRVESFREQDGAPQHYRAGAPDGSRPGVYYAHLSDMNMMPNYDMESVAYHEGIPGHHLQISIQRELTGLPEFRKTARFTAYSEGWGLYSERLAKEMGGFEDPYKDFGRLNAEIWRAIRLVVDTGMHAKGWSQDEAVDYFMANSSIAEGAIRAEVRRYLVMPGQATSYKIGMLKILELREKAQAELGGQFDIRAFHDTILGGGALPLSVLERIVDNWIEEVKV